MNDNIYQQTPPAAPQNSTMATVSMISGILGWVLAPLHRLTRRDHHRSHGKTRDPREQRSTRR
jgi:hypothetical protein